MVAGACASGGEGTLDEGVVVGPDSGCLTCHQQAGEDQRSSGLHRGAGGSPGCLVCHAPHAVGEPAPPPVPCASCHALAAAEFELPFAHPLGATLTCTSCHPPHGLEPRELRAHLRREACVDCHREYAGPFQFHHEGSHLDQCLSCHLPHGSHNRRLLSHADSRSLCFSCHLLLGDEHRQNPGSLFRECLQCHVAVHGSHWDRELRR